MATRKRILATNEIYHTFNRSVARQEVFKSTRDKNRFLETIDFYRFENTGISYSHFIRTSIEKRNEILESLYSSEEKIVEIFAFAIMPNHFHFLLQQKKDFGIKKFLSQIQNSYAKYYNTKYKRSGSLFQEMFKAVRIETDEQFIHIARYVHLNPITGYLINNIEELSTYPWTSFRNYIKGDQTSFTKQENLLNFFPSINTLKEFTSDQIGYQRELNKIKHLFLEEK